MADEIDNDDVAVLGHEPPMSERDNFVRTINAHKKANKNNNNNNAPLQLLKIGEEGEKKLEYAKKLEEAIQSTTPKSTIETNFDLENMDISLPDTDNDVDVEKSIVLIPFTSEEEEADKVEVSTNKVVRPKKDYPTDKRIMLLVVLVAFSIYFGIAASFYFG